MFMGQNYGQVPTKNWKIETFNVLSVEPLPGPVIVNLPGMYGFDW